MRYSIRVKGNRRMMVAYFIIGILLIFTIVPLMFIPGTAGVLVAMLFAFLSYQMIRMLVLHVKSYILTHDEGITLRFPNRKIERLTWNDVTHTGAIKTPHGSLLRFLYAEDKDRLATIPDEYYNLDELDKEMKEHSAWFDLEQKEGETIQSLIKPLTKHADTEIEEEDKEK